MLRHYLRKGHRPRIRSRQVYLPAGRWKNIFTGEEQEGGCEIEAEAPLDVIPVFERL